MYWLLVALTLLCAPVWAAEKTFTLTYKGTQRWVAQADAAPLRALSKTARTLKTNRFTVILPSQNRELAVERLLVVRDILSTNLKTQVVLEEIAGETPANTLTVQAIE